MTQTFAAMSATMFIAAEAATKEIGNWMPDRLVVEFEYSKLVATSAGSKSLAGHNDRTQYHSGNIVT